MSTVASVQAGPPEPWKSRFYAEAIGASGGSLTLRDAEGWCLSLDVRRWCARADAADRAVVKRCSGRVLDIGCGAGRFVEALARRGHHVLGIDVCPTAVISTVCRGGAAASRSVFDVLPDEGRWDTALLIDGNIGIGGDPLRLLRRIRDLVRPVGLLIVETSPVEVDERRRVRLHAGGQAAGPVFSWATVGVRALERHAGESGWSAAERWTSPAGDRHFVALRARA
ncbi:class I SAM-dependent methyltransferase [Streptomyces sp. G-G2]|uniref:class I SAM-dependent methyltransferase n=1 Tax=Streptomyces sp. G-G2 TaxID=3046201 RepID=UPI0024BAEF3D|nr:class I SAM-dependent methyltransferase [Streptomyces sp. G-G2]MDJ0384518.1 class I SAM-dependent methyltransferase [Streptomyces sp. G-G2]